VLGQLAASGPSRAPSQAAWAPACSASSEAALTSARLAGAKTQRRDMAWRSERPCLEVVAVRAGSRAGANTATNTLDRSLATRWAGNGGRQWLLYDLGTERMVDAVSVVWYAARKATVAAKVEISADNVTFAEVDAATLSGRGTHTALRAFLPATARYVRLTLTPAPGGPGLSVYEVGIHPAAGEAAAGAQ
jgi:hypothetical protein